MNDLILSDTIVDEARQTRDRVETELARADIPGEVVVTGPASIPGVLTRGDIDLHLRVDPALFETAVERLRTIYPPASLRSWAPTLAVFDVPAARPTGLAVTPVASTHDKRFTSAWQRLPNEPDLLREYNAIKLQDQTVDVYEERKSAFFDRIAKC